MVNNFEQLFYYDQYQDEFTAKVIAQKTEKNKKWLALSQTCFYPEGGGQPGDRGKFYLLATDKDDLETKSIQYIDVFDTILKDSIIWHQVNYLIPVETEIRGVIDFGNRYDLMQQHSAEHIVSGIVNRDYGYQNVGFNISQTEMTFDFDGDLNWQQITRIENEANGAIFENLPIVIHYLTPEEQETWTYRSKLELGENVRLVVIENYDICACAGTHLKTTGEIGQIKIIKRESYKGGVRLTALCGIRALKYFQHLQKIMKKTGEILSANPENMEETLLKRKNEIETLKQEIQNKNNAWLELFKKNIPTGTRNIIYKNKQFNKHEWLYVCKGLISSVEDFVCLITPSDENTFLLFMYSERLNLLKYIPTFKKRFSFKGGGNNNLVQGSIQGNYQVIKSFLTEMA